MRLLVVFSGADAGKICRYYHKRRAFFMEYLSTKMLTNFRQEWYSHYGDIMRFSIDVRTVEG
jgi:hypothetical protein